MQSSTPPEGPLETCCCCTRQNTDRHYCWVQLTQKKKKGFHELNSGSASELSGERTAVDRERAVADNICADESCSVQREVGNRAGLLKSIRASDIDVAADQFQVGNDI